MTNIGAGGVFVALAMGISKITIDTVLKWLLLAVLIVMIVRLERMRYTTGASTWLPGVAIILATAAGLLCLVFGVAEDLVYYACCAGMLAAAAWELIIINRAHNAYASRPVPYFDHEEEQA